jgi:hypothetical protein
MGRERAPARGLISSGRHSHANRLRSSLHRRHQSARASTELADDRLAAAFDSPSGIDSARIMVLFLDQG